MTKSKCNCIRLCNEALKAQNCELATVMTFDFKARVGNLSMVIPLRKIDSDTREGKRTKLPTLFPTYCPICGRKLIKTQKLRHEVKKQ